MTTATDTSPAQSVLGGLDAIIKPLESLYRDLHTHPELSDHEKRTAAKAAEQLEWAGCEVSTGVGGTGVVGVLRNGDGPTVMLRADMDALPVKEDTGLPYASTATATGPDGHTVPSCTPAGTTCMSPGCPAPPSCWRKPRRPGTERSSRCSNPPRSWEPERRR